MHFLRVNVMFYYSVNMIHDVITKANPFPYTAKFMLVGVRNIVFKDFYCRHVIIRACLGEN